MWQRQRHHEQQQHQQCNRQAATNLTPQTSPMHCTGGSTVALRVTPSRLLNPNTIIMTCPLLKAFRVAPA
jgi:hypothetical protein